jgi:hypothetical protein
MDLRNNYALMVLSILLISVAGCKRKRIILVLPSNIQAIFSLAAALLFILMHLLGILSAGILATIQIPQILYLHIFT